MGVGISALNFHRGFHYNDRCSKKIGSTTQPSLRLDEGYPKWALQALTPISRSEFWKNRSAVTRSRLRFTAIRNFRAAFSIRRPSPKSIGPPSGKRCPNVPVAVRVKRIANGLGPGARTASAAPDSASHRLHRARASRLPWELIQDCGDGTSPQALAAMEATPFSRYLAGQWIPGSPVLKRPVRILAAIANPTDLEDHGLSRSIATKSGTWSKTPSRAR